MEACSGKSLRLGWILYMDLLVGYGKTYVVMDNPRTSKIAETWRS